MTRGRGFALLVGWTLVVAGLVSLWWVEDVRPSEGPPKTALVYVLDVPAKFTIEADDQQVRFDTRLAVPARTLPDPRQTYSYQIVATIRDFNGDVIAERSQWVRSRVVRLGAIDGPLLPTATMMELPDHEILDNRVVVFDVAGLAPRGGTIDIDASRRPAGSSVYFLAFHRISYASLEVARRRHRIPETRTWFDPFGDRDLPDRWRDALAGLDWERLGALPPRYGGVVPTRTLHYDRIREMDDWEGSPALGMAVRPGGAATFNVRGTGELHLQWWTLENNAPVSAAMIVRTDGAGMSETLAAAPETVVPFGPETLSINVALDPGETKPRLLRAFTAGAALERAWGRPPQIADQRGLERVSPELRSLVLWRVSPGALLAFAAKPGEILRVTVRPRLGLGPLPALAPGVAEPAAAVTVDVVDATGSVLATTTRPALAVPSAWERYTEGDDPAVARVSEPDVFYLRVPPGAAGVRVSSDGIADVLVRVKVGDGEASYGPEYTLAATAADSWGVRYAPQIEDPWIDRYPDDADALVVDGRQPRIDAQVRLVGRGDASADATGSLPWFPLPLPPAWDLVAAPAGDSSADVGVTSHLGRQPTSIVVPADGDVAIDYRVALSQVGRLAAFTVDGSPIAAPMTAAGGRVHLRHLAPGRAKISVETPGLFLARATGGPEWLVRRIWAAGERSVRLPAGVTRVIVQLWTTGGGRTVSWSLEEKTGFATKDFPFRGEEALAPTAEGGQALSFAGSLVKLEPLAVHCDPGPASDLKLSVTGGRAWIRVLTDVPVEESTSTRWWRTP